MTWWAAGAAVVGGVLGSNAASNAADSAAAGNAAGIAEQRRQYDLTRSDYAPFRQAGYGALAQILKAYGIQTYADQQPQENQAQVRQRLAPKFTDPKYGGNGVDDMGLDAAVQDEMARQGGGRSGTTGGPPLSPNPTGAEVLQDPGYAFGLQQGQQAIDRKVAAAGGRVSGAAIKGAARYGSDYASTKYGEVYQRRQDALNRLMAVAGLGQTSTAGSAAAGVHSANAISGLLSDNGMTQAGARLAQGNIWGNALNQGAAMYSRQNRGYNGLGSGFGNDPSYNAMDYQP